MIRSADEGSEGKQKAWVKPLQKRLLDQGKIEKLVAQLRALPSSEPELAEKLRTEADYFERNAERVRYPQFRRQHLFVGTGVIEAGLDRSRSQRPPRPVLLLSQRTLRGLLGEPDSLTFTSMSHTPDRAFIPARFI